ncbi:hypothetical protein WJ01_28065 [Burkholderia vietnamiensis]|nr:hypothetical protein WJ01_28065 [Burkholderia vietnamiensis]
MSSNGFQRARCNSGRRAVGRREQIGRVAREFVARGRAAVGAVRVVARRVFVDQRVDQRLSADVERRRVDDAVVRGHGHREWRAMRTFRSKAGHAARPVSAVIATRLS